MYLNEIEMYNNELNKYSKIDIDWSKLKDKTFLITGATGLIGKFLIDLITYKNDNDNLNCKIIALGRNKDKARERFFNCFDKEKVFKFYEVDINKPIEIEEEKIDYIFHAASSTHPLQYSNFPISTITANVIGTKNILDLAVKTNTKRVLFASSVEIYGENRGDIEKFDESYIGYINCNTLRAGYPESKRTGEALCQAYIKEKNLDIIIPRLSRIFGPTILSTDSKALSQFINRAVNDEDIVLKSEGNQYFSYLYVGDAVTAILYLLINGKNGEAYNVSDEDYDITLRDLANIIARKVNKKVIFDIPTDDERNGYSTATKALLNNKKIRKLGWKVESDLDEALTKTISILKSIQN